MNIISRLGPHFFKKIVPKPVTTERAYNLWADGYDSQPDNLMLAWDEEIFSRLLSCTRLKGKMVADIGCGTGRHWQKIYELEPKKLIGFDISAGMLHLLKKKFPAAEVYHLKNDHLVELENDSVDFVISTLTIAHIENIADTLAEWKRILRRGGELIITDYHPTALAKGGKRTFNHNGKTVAVKNYVHSIDQIKLIANQLSLDVYRLTEMSIDESAKPFYEKQNALHVYEVWKGTPIIYGIHLKKNYATL